MRQWIGLIVVFVAAYFVWDHFGAKNPFKEQEGATPEITWYLNNIGHAFEIVQERDKRWILHGYHQNDTKSVVLSATLKVFMEKDSGWTTVETFQLGMLEPEKKKYFDLVIRVPKGVEDPELRWELTKVTYRP